MAFYSISQVIQDAVAQLPDSIYLRATDYEANVELDNIDLDGKTVFIYNNLPVINYALDIAILPQWPIVIKVMQMTDLDANTQDKDLQREAMVEPAQDLLKLLLSDSISSQAVLPPNATITFLDNDYDKNLTGVELAFVLQLNPVCWQTN